MGGLLHSHYAQLRTKFPTVPRRIKTQTVLPSAETAAMLFWALLASGQITMRKVDGWQTLAEKPAAAVPLDLAA
jgi:putative transposase